ncbi:MATE family efflux transporter [Paenibacillus sp. 1011MAR3C5]|uniref:MATE family efflux transporter n=1 Tax=Paenibacillus sp. 1011MAR3C5 TaxID=1675787 RepID=UPI0011C435D2|nr:MATE family efflux transporter [Paenibacillus sp. 1011MAR3C5]
MKLEDNFYRKLAQLAFPLTLQFIFTSSFVLIDTLMVSGLGEKEVAALGIAGQFDMMLVIILAGILSGPSIFMMQYYGQRDYKTINGLAGLCLYAGLGIGTFFFLAVTLSSPYLFMPFSRDSELLKLTSSFVAIVSYGYIASAVSTAFAMSLKSIGDVKAVMYMTTSCLLLNTLLNYPLIYGHFGFPALGIQGAAIATLIGKLLLMIMIVAYVYTKRREVAVSVRRPVTVDRALTRKVFKLTMPIIAHETLWGLGAAIYMVAFGMLGTATLAVIQVAKVISVFVFAAVAGFSQAAGIMIGEQIGRRQRELAQTFARRFTRIGLVLALVIGALLFTMAPLIVGMFQFDEPLNRQAINILRIFACLMVFIFVNNIWIVGVFRSGGDTRYSMKLVLGSTWLVGLPITFIGAGVLKWPVEFVYALYLAEEVMRTVIGYFRYRSRRWQHDLVDNHEPV